MNITDIVGRITAPTPLLDYHFEQFHPGQPAQMFGKLTAPKENVKLTAATGAQLHCSPMAPGQHCAVLFDWLQETLHSRWPRLPRAMLRRPHLRQAPHPHRARR